ncbi:MAG: hypothetical protein QXI92_00150 [Candidatus Nitrosocaldus sp.]
MVWCGMVWFSQLLLHYILPPSVKYSSYYSSRLVVVSSSSILSLAVSLVSKQLLDSLSSSSSCLSSI